MLSPRELLSAVAAAVSLTVALAHMLSELEFLLERDLQSSLAADITEEPPLVSPLDVLPLLVPVREGLQTSLGLVIGAL